MLSVQQGSPAHLFAQGFVMDQHVLARTARLHMQPDNILIDWLLRDHLP